MTDLTFSAILPNYNSSEFIETAIQSLLNQTDAFTEIIIVDDGSTDNSLALIQPYLDAHPQIKLIQHQKNQGVSAALNTGIMAASGDYIILCAADDRYDPHIVECSRAALLSAPDVGVICGDALVNRYDLPAPFRRTLPFVKNTFISAAEFKALAKHAYVGFNSGGGMFMNRKAILRTGLLHPELRWHSDWFLYFLVAYLQGVYYLDTLFIHINMRKEGYAEGKKNFALQKQVIIDTITILHQQYPALWKDFKEAALLPHYSLKYLPLFIFHPLLRQFMTARLWWKCVINNTMVIRIGRMFPYRIILGARKLLRA